MRRCNDNIRGRLLEPMILASLYACVCGVWFPSYLKTKTIWPLFLVVILGLAAAYFQSIVWDVSAKTMLVVESLILLAAAGTLISGYPGPSIIFFVLGILSPEYVGRQLKKSTTEA